MANFSKTVDCRDCELKINLFCYMTEEQLSRLNKERKEVTFQANETMVKHGGPLTHILCLTSGMAKVYIEDSSDKRILIGLVKPTQLIGGPGFLVDERNHITVTALEETKTCFIDVNDFKAVMKANSEFTMELVKYLNERIIKYLDRILSLTHKHMHGKLAETLLYLSDAVYNSDKFETLLNRQDLADMSAMTKESVIRILKEFNEEGIIISDLSHFEIVNKKLLMKISQTG